MARTVIGAIGVAVVVLVSACSSAKLGESCEDEGRIGGDCDEGLMCAHTKNDEVSPLVCMKPCASDANCSANENCNGERAINLKVCRPR